MAQMVKGESAFWDGSLVLFMASQQTRKGRVCQEHFEHAHLRIYFEKTGGILVYLSRLGKNCYNLDAKMVLSYSMK